jgi:CPA1 family monovalent cation:H+ antiporter
MAIAAVLGIHMPGEPVTAGWVAKFFLWEVGLGLVIGVAVGLLVSYMATLVHDHLIEIMLTTLAAFGSFVIAEALHASFVLAVVAAGMACGNVGARYGMTPTNRIAVASFWEYAVFVANSFVFLLLGKEIDLARLWALAIPILIAWTVLMAARTVVITLVTGALRKSSERLPPRWPTVLVWGGLRGSLSMVLAVSLPETFAHRQLLIDLVFGVVLVSILVQGLTMAPVLRWAGVVGGGPEKRAYMRIRGAMRATRDALARLDLSLSRGDISDTTHELFRERLGGRLAELEEGMVQLEPHAGPLRADEIRRANDQLLDAEREAIQSALKEGLITEDVAKELLHDIDVRGLGVEDLIAQQAVPPEAQAPAGEPSPAERAESEAAGREPAERDGPGE